MRSRYRRHNAEVLAYFKDRPEDLLVMDMDAGAGWKELCGFFRKTIPSVPYPLAFQSTVDDDTTSLILEEFPMSDEKPNDKILIPLDQFNKDAIKHYDKKDTSMTPNGLACPHCQKELVDVNPAIVVNAHRQPHRSEVSRVRGFSAHRYLVPEEVKP